MLVHLLLLLLLLLLVLTLDLSLALVPVTAALGRVHSASSQACQCCLRRLQHHLLQTSPPESPRLSPLPCLLPAGRCGQYQYHCHLLSLSLQQQQQRWLISPGCEEWSSQEKTASISCGCSKRCRWSGDGLWAHRFGTQIASCQRRRNGGSEVPRGAPPRHRARQEARQFCSCADPPDLWPTLRGPACRSLRSSCQRPRRQTSVL